MFCNKYGNFLANFLLRDALSKVSLLLSFDIGWLSGKGDLKVWRVHHLAP